MRSNILIITYALNQGGMERSLFRLTKYLNTLEYSVSIILTEDKGVLYNDFSQITTVKYVGENKWGALELLNKLKREIDIINPDIIINFLDKYTQALIPFLNPSIKYLPNLRTDDSYFVNVLTTNQDYVDSFLCNSPRLAELIKNKLSEYISINTCPNGIAIPNTNIYEKRIVFDKTIRLLFVGRLESQKNVMILPEIISKCRDKGIDLTLDIIGYGALEVHLQKQIEAYKLQDIVNLQGLVVGEKLIEFYKGCHIFLFPSLNEGLPNVLLEAQMYGCVPISSIIPDITNYVIKNFETGLVVENNKVDNFVSAIGFLWNDKNEWLRMSSNATVWIVNNFTEDHEKKLYQVALNNVLNSPQKKKKISFLSYYNVFALIRLREFTPVFLLKIYRLLKNKFSALKVNKQYFVFIV